MRAAKAKIRMHASLLELATAALQSGVVALAVDAAAVTLVEAPAAGASSEIAARPNEAAGAAGATGQQPDRAETEPAQSSVARQAVGRGFAYHPSTPPLHAFRLALGGYWDAIDPQVMYGYPLRFPQVSLDARYGLGKGFSLGGHFNSMFVVSELTLGGRYARRFDNWSVEGALNVGVYLGKLAQFGFDALLVAPEYKPELTFGWDLGSIAISLRGTLILMGPERARVGDVWGGLDNSNAFVGHSEMVFVENTTSTDSIWYFGLGAMTTRAYYAMWLLFPDSPALFTYPRIVAGYEF
jgi:hypothetical protein